MPDDADSPAAALLALVAQWRLSNNLAALTITRGWTNTERIPFLRASGYSTAEVADLLGLSAHNVAQVEYDSRKKREGVMKQPKSRRKNGKGRP